MRVLITGATGFIGRHLAARLAGEHEVIGLVRRVPSPPIPGVRYVTQDLTAPLDLAQLPARIDAVIHQAALIEADTAAQQSDLEAAPFLVNVVATWRLLRYAAAAGAQRFIHASTGGVYGCRDTPFREEDPFNPMDLYSLTKSQAELAVRHRPGPDDGTETGADHRKMVKVILRYFFPYGPGTPNPIPTYVTRALDGTPIPIPTNRKPHFNPIHIDDAVTATVGALALDADTTLNIGGREITSFAAIAEMAAGDAGRTPVFTEQPDDEVIPYYRADLVADCSKMQHLLGITPQVPLAAGIAQLVDALR